MDNENILNSEILPSGHNICDPPRDFQHNGDDMGKLF